MSLLEQPDQVLLLTLRQEAGAGRVERLERERQKQDLNEDGLASLPKNQLFTIFTQRPRVRILALPRIFHLYCLVRGQ